MNRFFDFLEHTLAPLGTKLGNQRHLKAVRDGFMMAMPLVLVGSFFLLLISWPDEAFGFSVQDFLKGIGIYDVLSIMNQSTMAIISLVAVFGIAYRLAESYGVDAPSAGVLSLSSFILMIPRFSTTVFNEKGEEVTQLFNGALPFGNLNANSLFVAITVGIVTT